MSRMEKFLTPEIDARLHAAVRADSAETGICLRCGRSHDQETRRRLIRPMRDMMPVEIVAAWPCFYPDYRKGSATEAMLARDLREVRR